MNSKPETPRKALGKGISALIRPNSAPVEPPPAHAPQVPVAPGPITHLPIDLIFPNPLQPRKHFDEQALEELAQSIRVEGVIQPLVVRPKGEKYEIIAGERRWRAARKARLDSVPVVVQTTDDEKTLELALVENIQREDLNPIEVAIAFQQMSADLGLSHEEISRRTGKERTVVTNAIRLLQLPPDLQAHIAAARLSAGHGRLLLRLATPDEQRKAAESALEGKMTVRQLEAAIDAEIGKKPRKLPPPPQPLDPNVRFAISELEQVLGTRVRIVPAGKGKGKIEIEYYSAEDLDRIYSTIHQR